MTTWEATLDLLEDELNEIAASLEAGAVGVGVELGDPQLPSDLGPLPEHLRDRARSINARQRQVEAELALAVQRARQAMVLGDSSPQAGPALFDTRH